MATRFNFGTDAAPITPSYGASWDNTTGAVRHAAIRGAGSTGATSLSNNTNGGAGADEDHLVVQYISETIEAQTIPAQNIEAVFRCQETNVASNQFLTLVIRVVSNDGSVVRGNILSITRDNTEMAADNTRTRHFTATTTEVTSLNGDRIIIEVGTGGNPAATGSHDVNIQVRTNSTDLATTENATTAGNPWLEFPTTITGFGTSPTSPPTLTSITPNTGTESGGTSVTLEGTDFVSGATVTIGGNAATGVSFVDSTEITATTPAGTVGAQDVVLTNPDTQSDTLTGGFTYTAASAGAVHTIHLAPMRAQR
jgi:hypothetical protein